MAGPFLVSESFLGRERGPFAGTVNDITADTKNSRSGAVR
jgi:hypothetical protein